MFRLGERRTDSWLEADNALRLAKSSIGQFVIVGATKYVGIRIRDVTPMPAGASLSRVDMTLYAYETNVEDATYRVFGVLELTPDSFLETKPSERPLTSVFTTWVPPPATAIGQPLIVDGLRATLQQVIDQPGWTEGNDVGFVLERIAGERKVFTYQDAVDAGQMGYLPTLDWEYGVTS